MHGAPLEVVDRPCLGGRQQSTRVVERARFVRGLGRRHCALRSSRKRGGPLQKGSSGRQTAARLRPAGGPLQLTQSMATVGGDT